ncbi:YbdK family carboxylate-amine ligase [Microbacterium sp. 1.5R]|uniref:carboxylate-amine ligase n=1 Tax=Microbacterium sp. 1.5R TaxID=1916917 RepID=UPI0011A6C4DA|nr:YbdK family carboxylate-amine ligase [Microbacterium sp. 1.5R]
MARFGVEEEFFLLDGKTLLPLSMNEGTRDRIVGHRAGGTVTPEFLTSQLETASAPLDTTADARVQLQGMRVAMARDAAEDHAIVAATGTPFVWSDEVVVSSSPHYDRVAALLGGLTRTHEVNGLHVHVEVHGDEERAAALNRIRAWMPALLALTGNSPFDRGVASGFASWRSILTRRLPTGWTPPHSRDYAQYRAHVDGLLALGGVTEATSIGWTARLSERYPTVEVRVCDAQLDVDDALLAVALSRALVASEELDACPEVGLDAIDASLWTAARFGQQARIVDPTTGDAAPTWDVVERMLSRIAPALTAQGDDAFVAAQLARIREQGTGAERQLRALAQGGPEGLRDLYRATTAPEDGSRQ